MKRVGAVAGLALFGIVPTSAVAQTAAPQGSKAINANRLLEPIGGKETRTISGSTCQIDILIDQEKLLDALPVLQQVGILNEDITPQSAKKQKTRITFGFAIQVGALSVKTVYDDEPAADRCVFSYSVILDDDYGNPQRRPLMMHEFSRDIYKRINFSRFPSQNLMLIAPNFRFGAGMGEKIDAEGG